MPQSGRRTPRRSNRYYRKLYLDEYINNEPDRGLGLHRLPRIKSKSNRQRNRRSNRPGGAVWIIVLLAVVVAFFVCSVLCLLVVNALV